MKNVNKFKKIIKTIVEWLYNTSLFNGIFSRSLYGGLSGSRNITLSLVIPVYCYDSKYVSRLIEYYDGLNKEIKNRFEIILIDDCSPEEVHLSECNLNVSVYKILDDIPWNIPGARNLGVSCACGDNIALVDMDHYFSANAIEKMVNANLKDKEVWLFKRFRDNQKHITHKATLFMRKSTFFEVNGCDEDFSGNYGSDGHLRACLVDYGCELIQTNFRVDTYLDIDGSNQHNLVRDTSQNKEMMDAKNISPNNNHSKKILRFRWKFSEKREVY